MATKKVPPNVMILGDEYEWWVTSNTPWVEEGFLSVSYGQLRDAPEQIEEGISHIYDVYKKNRQTGSIIIIDEQTNETIGAGMII